MKYIVDIKGEIEGDYEIIGKYDEVLKGTDTERRCGMTIDELNEAIKTIRAICYEHKNCVECPLTKNCNECPGDWQEVTNNDV